MVKIAFSSPFAHKQPKKDAEALVPEQDPEIATRGTENSTGRCLLTLLGLAFILAGVIVGGACLYKYFMPKHKVYHGQLCYSESQDRVPEPYFLPIVEEADIREEENFALIDVSVQKSSDSDPAAIMHDFDRLLTAYLNLHLNKCYVTPLNTSVVMRPRSLIVLFVKLGTSPHVPPSTLVHEEMVVTETENVSELGILIYQLCAGKETFRVQRRDQMIGLQKRSAEECHVIRHFENEFAVETKICEQ
ncbi:integral membrane protein 2A [Microcaecilia unicolor]|uniref:Integral membrane protein 2 n=1 Tax=Microcaecilia unicolor TaxID=1415580 RepID=A0A6P7YQ95_9AMPH|nr:integral membrane protein 2A [Microcaecilia unicolor]